MNNNLTKGFAILSFAGIFVKVLSLLYLPFLLAILGEEGNGVYAKAYQAYVMIYVITNSGIPVAISKIVSELNALGRYRDALSTFKIARFFLIIAGILTCLLLILMAKPIANEMESRADWAIIALAPTLVFSSMASAYRGYFQGLGNMTPTALSQILEQVVNTIFTLLLAFIFINFGIRAACAGGAAGTSLGALAAFALLAVMYSYHKNSDIHYRQQTSEQFHSHKELLLKIFFYSLPVTVCLFMQYSGNLIDVWNTTKRLIVSGLSEGQATENYNYLYKYQQLLNAPLAMVVALATAVLPSISESMALKKHDEVQNKIESAFKLDFIIVIPSAVGFSVLAQPIFDMLKFGEGAFLMQWGSVTLVLLSIVQIQTSILQGVGKVYAVTLNLMAGVAAKIIVNYFLIAIPSVRIMGAIAGSIASYCLPIVLNFMTLRNSLGLKLRLSGRLVKPVISSAAMTAIIFPCYRLVLAIMRIFFWSEYINNAIATLLAIVLGIFTYGTCMILIGGVNQADLSFLPRQIMKLIPKKWFYIRYMIYPKTD